MNLLQKALDFTLQWEGHFVNNPADKGGPTNYGITQHTYNLYRNSHGLSVQSVQKISSMEVQAIYQELFWLPLSPENLSPRLAVAAFDWAVNSGVGRIKHELQIYHDAESLCNRREAFYKQIGIGSQHQFLTGWLNRLNALRTYLKAIPE